MGEVARFQATGGRAVITCSKCSKDNQDHYKFCLGCGAELPRDASPKPFSPPTPSQGVRAAQPTSQQAKVAPPVAAAPPAAAPVPAAQPVSSAQAPQPTAAEPAKGGDITPCPQCGHGNLPANIFCGSCGFRVGGAAPKPQAAAPPAAKATAGGLVLTALRADGTEAGTYALPGPETMIGRETGGIFAGDSYLSPRHAHFSVHGASATVKDQQSLNGIYKRLMRDAPIELKPGDVFRIGQEIIRFEALSHEPPSPDGVERLGAPAKGYVGRLALVIGRDETGNAFPIPESGVHLGRERGDILFPEDGYVSGLHCRLSWEGGRLFLTDLGSSNGTFVRIHGQTEVQTGDILLMGQQLFRIAI